MGDEVVLHSHEPNAEHAERLTKLEGTVPELERKFEDRLSELRHDLSNAIDEGDRAQVQRVEGMITEVHALIAKLEAQAATVVQKVVAVPEEVIGDVASDVGAGVNFVAPELESSPKPPEKQPHGRRARRRARRKG